MKKNTASGFSLIELSIVMIVVGLLISIGFSLVPNYLQSAKVTAARTQMKEIQNAIEGFAIANNRLPCPDTDADGAENIASNICTAYGITVGSRYNTADLPYRTLGLPNNRDPWGRIIKYAVYMMRTVTGNCTNAASCDFATDLVFDGSSTSRTRTNFCSKLTTALQLTRSISTEIYTARLLSTNVGSDAGSLCNTGTTMEGSPMAYIVASSGFNNADQDTGTAGLFDGTNDPGNKLCFENPDRVLRFLDASEQKSTDTPDNYDDIVLGGSVSGLISRLECN
ncbi:MAG: type II secretion system GspH family protein [Magnetococcus sp. DMHC-1]